MPSTFSLRAIRLPTPQISSTGCSESSFRVLCGFPLVSASTPRNCFHSLRPTGLILRGFSLVRRPRQWSGGYSHTRADAAAGRSPQAPYSAPPVRSRNISSMEYCSTGASSSGQFITRADIERKVHNYLKKHIFFPGTFRFYLKPRSSHFDPGLRLGTASDYVPVVVAQDDYRLSFQIRAENTFTAGSAVHIGGQTSVHLPRAVDDMRDNAKDIQLVGIRINRRPGHSWAAASVAASAEAVSP